MKNTRIAISVVSAVARQVELDRTMTIGLLKRAGLLVVFLSAAGPAAAETVTMSCKYEQSPGTTTLRVDYATGLVEEVGGERASGQVSADAIVWSGMRSIVETAVDNVTKRYMTTIFRGRIDRLSGTGWIETGYSGTTTTRPVTCSRVTAPKF